MIFHRLTTIAQTIKLWPFFTEGIAYSARYLRYDYPLEIYRRILWSLVKQPETGWVGVVFDPDNNPVAFVMAHDVTPIFVSRREFEISMFYYSPGHKGAIKIIQKHFENFCLTNGVCRYYLTTSSFCASARRAFQDAWQGLERSNIVYKRKLPIK